jgi:hypothetical protein
MQKVSGQKPVVTKPEGHRGFKIREGYPIGCMVTLRRNGCTSSSTASSRSRCRVYATSAAFPARVRRPRQLQHRHQGTDHFPGDRVRQDRCVRGMNITITTTAKTDAEARALLTAFRFRSGTKADHVETGFDQSQREAQEARRQVHEEARLLQAIVDDPKASEETRTRPA